MSTGPICTSARPSSTTSASPSPPPGQGFAEHALPIPNDPALIGDAGYFQFNDIHPSVAAFGGSQATGVWVGS